MNTCCLALLFDCSCDILVSYLWRYKGGRCDLDGETVTHRRGGSTENPLNALHCQKILAGWGNTRNQIGRRYLAGESIRYRCLHSKADVPETRGMLTTHLAFLPAVQRHLPTSYQPISKRLCPYCFMLILQHMATNCNFCNRPQWLQVRGSVERELS